MLSADNCPLNSHTYNRHCEHCMARLIVSARSPDRATTRRSQTSIFQYMGKDMEEKVKKLLTQEKSGV